MEVKTKKKRKRMTSTRGSMIYNMVSNAVFGWESRLRAIYLPPGSGRALAVTRRRLP